MQIVPTSIKGRGSINAGMVTFCRPKQSLYKFRKSDASILYWVVRQANASPLVSCTRRVCGWMLAVRTLKVEVAWPHVSQKTQHIVGVWVWSPYLSLQVSSLSWCAGCVACVLCWYNFSLLPRFKKLGLDKDFRKVSFAAVCADIILRICLMEGLDEPMDVPLPACAFLCILELMSNDWLRSRAWALFRSHSTLELKSTMFVKGGGMKSGSLLLVFSLSFRMAPDAAALANRWLCRWWKMTARMWSLRSSQLADTSQSSTGASSLCSPLTARSTPEGWGLLGEMGQELRPADPRGEEAGGERGDLGGCRWWADRMLSVISSTRLSLLICFWMAGWISMSCVTLKAMLAGLEKRRGWSSKPRGEETAPSTESCLAERGDALASLADPWGPLDGGGGGGRPDTLPSPPGEPRCLGESLCCGRRGEYPCCSEWGIWGDGRGRLVLSDVRDELEDGTGEETESWRMAGDDSDPNNLKNDSRWLCKHLPDKASNHHTQHTHSDLFYFSFFFLLFFSREGLNGHCKTWRH